jgi:hypothetical protein
MIFFFCNATINTDTVLIVPVSVIVPVTLTRHINNRKLNWITYSIKLKLNFLNPEQFLQLNLYLLKTNFQNYAGL